MCTLILLDRIVPGVPVLVAANRDEFFNRPSAPPTLFERGRGRELAFVAPQDLEAGGTWMGINSAGVFVGLTNRPAEHRDDSRRSRGLLVMDALAQRSAQAVAEGLGEDLHRRYNPLHLVVADGRQSFLTTASRSGTVTRALEPGVQVVGNLDADDPSSEKVSQIRAAVQEIDPTAAFDSIFRGLIQTLGDHRDPSNQLENACVHTPQYGTRSAAVIALGDAQSGYWSADGPPCRAKFQDYTRLLDALRQIETHEEKC